MTMLCVWNQFRRITCSQLPTAVRMANCRPHEHSLVHEPEHDVGPQATCHDNRGGTRDHGGVWPAPPGQTSLVQLFMEVADVDDCIAKALTLGAKVIVPKSVLPDGDTMAVLLDPTGLSFGVCRLRD